MKQPHARGSANERNQQQRTQKKIKFKLLDNCLHGEVSESRIGDEETNVTKTSNKSICARNKKAAKETGAPVPNSVHHDYYCYF